MTKKPLKSIDKKGIPNWESSLIKNGVKFVTLNKQQSKDIADCRRHVQNMKYSLNEMMDMVGERERQLWDKVAFYVPAVKNLRSTITETSKGIVVSYTPLVEIKK